MTGDQIEANGESVFMSVKISTHQFIDLNPSYLEFGMFATKETASSIAFDLSAIEEDRLKTLVQKYDDDKDFGLIYAIIGKFGTKSLSGHVVVLQEEVVRRLETSNPFSNPSCLRLITFGSKTCINKIGRRTANSPFITIKTTTSLCFDFYSKTFLFIPGNTGNFTKHQIISLWTSTFRPNFPTSDGRNIPKMLKRRHSVFMNTNTADDLMDSADSTLPDRKHVQQKKLETLLEESIVSNLNEDIVKQKKSHINLREEAISLADGAFEYKWSPESFVEGFSNVKRTLCLSREELGAVAASMLMDPSYRITDCTPIANDNLIEEVGIDVDQFVLKCSLHFLNRSNADMDLVADLEIPIYQGYQKDFLKLIYGWIFETLHESKNDTTTFCPITLKAAQGSRGSSLDTAKQRRQYVPLCTKDLTSQVLNISYRSKERANNSDVKNASIAVIYFLLGPDSPFRNENSLAQLKAKEVTWNQNTKEAFYVPGGLLFPVLTAALLAYWSREEIDLVIETYGGKRRGVHVHWKFNETEPEDIRNIIDNVKEAEKLKIPFLIKTVFKIIQSKWRESVSSVSLHWGLGCDAIAKPLGVDEPSFLVCQPVTLDEVDKSRNGPTKDVFKQRPHKIPSTASHNQCHNSDFEQGREADELVRQKWFTPSEQRNHHRYIPFGQLCPFNLHSVTHHITKKSSLTGNVDIDENPDIRRVQSYSPNLRSPHGFGGIQKLGENLMDIRTFVQTTRRGDQSYISIHDAEEKSSLWADQARKHINLLAINNGMARLELTFQTRTLDNDDVFDNGVKTLMKAFVGSTKVYSSRVVANLAEISLLAFEGISRSLLLWFQGTYVRVPRCWNVFAEVWQYLTFFATNFFSGRRCYDRRASFTPRLAYLFSRPFINPSWEGINAALCQTCVSEKNLNLQKSHWYCTSGMSPNVLESLHGLKLRTIEVSGDYDTGIKAFMELLETECDSAPVTPNAAVACSKCKRITAKMNSESLEWRNHPCDAVDSDETVINLDSIEFKKYLLELSGSFSDSQKEATVAIISSSRNCFLTGVAGSGKSHVLKFIYPSLILHHGFARVCITATTNIAASNISGITLTRFMGLVVDSKTRSMVASAHTGSLHVIQKHIDYLRYYRDDVIQRIMLCEVLIIDEVGMCDLNTFKFLETFLRLVTKKDEIFGGVRIILVGDVLQLPPIGNAEEPGSGHFFFSSTYFDENFFIAYLRENHRQGDQDFLEALNKVRIGDPTVIDYLNKNIPSNNATSQVTLEMAKEKNTSLMSDKEYKTKLDNRRAGGYVNIERAEIGYYMTDSFTNRLSNAPKCGFSDLIVVLEHRETTLYTEIRSRGIEMYMCKSSGTAWDRNIPSEIFKNFNNKLPEELKVYIGMPCRVTYRTDNPNIVSNTMVVVKKITFCDGNNVDTIDIETTSRDYNPMKTTLKRVTIFDEVKGIEYSRTQFPIISSIGLLPWSLQCLTVSENIFYDNTFSTKREGSSKGFLYAIMSRVKRMEQFSFLFEFSEAEIRNGVDLTALKFDSQYRLRQPQVIFNLVD